MVVIEDNRSDVFLIEEAVAQHHLPVKLKVFENGKLAVDYLEEARGDAVPKLFLIDLNVPIKNGLEVLEFIRSTDRLQQVPVLIMTSSDSPKDRADAERLGAEVYFLKPFSYDQFLKIGDEIRHLLPQAVQV